MVSSFHCISTKSNIYRLGIVLPSLYAVNKGNQIRYQLNQTLPVIHFPGWGYTLVKKPIVEGSNVLFWQVEYTVPEGVVV